MPGRKKTAITVSGEADSRVSHLLSMISEGKRSMNSEKGQRLFSQGEPADAVYFVQSGKVTVSVVSSGGKEAVIAIHGPNSFIGEGALVGHSRRSSTATVLQPGLIYRIEKTAMTRALQHREELSEKFIAALLTRNIDLEADLCDQLFNHSEKRLARVLLKLSRLGGHEVAPDAGIPPLSHETLAEMVGTTRSRVTYFMNKFRAMGLIDYNGELTVRTELLIDLVLHD
jgi:CRP/FNR family cyclic AMP-dependent transcriptional regulator